MREDAKTRISTRVRLWKEQKGICPYCKREIKIEKASLDHIIPVFHLQDNIGEANLIMCCKWCNKNKGDNIVFTNLFDKEIYIMVAVPYVFQDYFIHSTKKIRKSY
jgi:CRISPR/Cas system Type II protein with McrA/HNH and RuvC-like nuclease domain